MTLSPESFPQSFPQMCETCGKLSAHVGARFCGQHLHEFLFVLDRTRLHFAVQRLGLRRLGVEPEATA